MSSKVEELIGVANDWDRAMVTNDAEAIGQYGQERAAFSLEGLKITCA